MCVSTKEYSGRKYTNIGFYHGSQLKITDGWMLKVGMTAERMYFCPTKAKGFKLGRGSTNMVYIRIPGWKEDFVGEHDLIFDPEEKLWFIPVKPKQKGDR